MATSSSSVNVNAFNTDGIFRAWGLALSTALQAAGLALVADSGTVNWTTVTRPTTASAKAGYEIYRFTDTLQTSFPIYFRIDYGTANVASGVCPGTWMTVGTGSDGAGNILNQTVPVTQMTSSGAATATNTAMTVGASYSVGAGAAFILGGTQPCTGLNNNWCIGRSCDTNGNLTGSGVVLYNNGLVTQPKMLSGNFSPITQYTIVNPGCGPLSTGVSVSTGGAIVLYRNYMLSPGPFPTNAAVCYFSTDISTNATFLAAPFGSTNHTYLAMGASNAGGFSSGQSANIVAAYIWE